MTAAKPDGLEQRVDRAAEAALAERSFVTAIDVLVGLGWLPPPRVDEWRQGRVDYLERALTVTPERLSAVMRLFRRWAKRRRLVPSETPYVARTRDHRSLRFSASSDPAIRARLPNPLALAGAAREKQGAADRAAEPCSRARGRVAAQGLDLHVVWRHG